MAQTLREIGAAVPLGAFVGVGIEAAGAEEQQFPSGLEIADIERERDRARLSWGPDRRPRHEVGVERLHVIVGELGEMVERERRKKKRPVARDPLVHRAGERRFRPCADSRLGIGRDVGRIEHAEGGMHRIPAGELLSAFGSVALRAKAAGGERLALGDKLRREAVRRGRADWRDRGPKRQQAESQGAEDDQPCNAKKQTFHRRRPSTAPSRLARGMSEFSTVCS